MRKWGNTQIDRRKKVCYPVQEIEIKQICRWKWKGYQYENSGACDRWNNRKQKTGRWLDHAESGADIWDLGEVSGIRVFWFVNSIWLLFPVSDPEWSIKRSLSGNPDPSGNSLLRSRLLWWDYHLSWNRYAAIYGGYISLGISRGRNSNLPGIQQLSPTGYKSKWIG